MKVAITSSDGRIVDTEFAKAHEIYVYTLEGNQIQGLEKRKTSHFCISGRRQAFSRNSFERVYETIKDCDITLTQRIRDIPRQRCQTLGITIRQVEGDIKEILGI